jgi:hypothetical protein
MLNIPSNGFIKFEFSVFSFEVFRPTSLIDTDNPNGHQCL